MTFWPSMSTTERNLCSHTAFINLVGQADAAVYDVSLLLFTSCQEYILTTDKILASQEMLNLLMEQILSQKASKIITGLKQTAKDLESVIKDALPNFDAAFHDRKVEMGARFGHLLGEYFLLVRRFTVILTHQGQYSARLGDAFSTASTVKTVLGDRNTLHQMKVTWHNLDWDNILNQAA